MTPKKIALFSHSSHLGGAETAFVNLVTLVKSCGHEPIVFLPSSKGGLVDIFQERAVETAFFKRASIYGNTSNALLDFSNRNLSEIEDELKQRGCELVISNSSTFVEAALAAAHLGLPHIWSIHEMQQDNPEQPRGGLADGAFARWFAALSDHQIFCSHATRLAHESKLTVKPESSVLPPFLESVNDRPVERAQGATGDVVNLMFIGAPTVRKNPVLAIEVTAALRARGRHVYLNFMGGRRDHTGLVDGLLKRRKLKPYVHFLGKVADPYQYFSGKAINFLCSKSEPFGLTVPESLSRGFPVVAPNIGGPAETLDPQFQFDLSNVDQCVRLIESVIDQYDAVSLQAKQNYQDKRHRFVPDHQVAVVAAAIESALRNFSPKKIPFELQHKALSQAVELALLSQDDVIQSIAAVTQSTEASIRDQVSEEHRAMGSAVNADVRAFDVVPFQPSAQMDTLYRTGTSFAVELAGAYKDGARLKMAAFMLVRLCTERTRIGRNLKVLAVGDGIGSDSIRLASAGFDVDYMAYEASVTSSVAAENFRKFKSAAPSSIGNLRVLNRHEIETGTYDAVISLEVIEHVEKPNEFLDFLHQQLAADGLLFLSDCFPGITDYWQTHLLSNERLSGFVPLMAVQAGLAYVGASQQPLCKPYVFQKSSTPVDQLLMQVLSEPDVMEVLLYEQKKLVKQRARKIDKLIYNVKRLAINVRGYLARRRLAV